MKPTDIISLVLPEVALTSAQRSRLNNFLTVSQDVDNKPRPTRRFLGRREWHREELDVIYSAARHLEMSASEILSEFFSTDDTVTLPKLQAQMYILFPRGERDGIKFS